MERRATFSGDDVRARALIAAGWIGPVVDPALNFAAAHVHEQRIACASSRRYTRV